MNLPIDPEEIATCWECRALVKLEDWERHLDWHVYVEEKTMEWIRRAQL